MAKKSLPALVYVLLFLVATSGMVVGGYFLMRRTLVLAEIRLSETGFMLVNRNVKDWPGGKVSLNDHGGVFTASFPALKPDEGYTISFAKFSDGIRDSGQAEIVLKRIWIEDMSGFQDRSFPVPEPVKIVIKKTP